MTPIRGLLAWLALGAGLGWADEFRIQNRVYVGKASAPSAVTVTLFARGLVYDVLSGPDEIVVFHPTGGRFVLLKPARKIRTEISTDQVNRMVETLQAELKNRGSGLSEFLAAPKFEIDDSDSSDAKFTGDFAEYRVKTTRAASLIAARQYAEFADWYTRLNTMNNPALLARVPVNAWLTKREQVPTEIEATFYNKTFGFARKQQSLRSEHVITWFLSQDDRKQIEQIDGWLVTFEKVEFEQYRNTPAFAAP